MNVWRIQSLSLEFEPVRCRALEAWIQFTLRCGHFMCLRINPVCIVNKLKVTFSFQCCLGSLTEKKQMQLGT